MFRTFLVFLLMVTSLCSCGLKFTKTGSATPQTKVGDGPPAPRLVYLISGYRGTLLVSEDLDHWTQAPVTQGPHGDNNFTFRGSCSLPGVLLVVGGGTPMEGEVMARMARSTNGKDWVETKEDLQWMGGCAYGNETAIIAGGYGLARRSTDLGKTWERAPTMKAPGTGEGPIVIAFRSVRFVEGLFYLFADNGWVATSEDGLGYEYTKYPTSMNELTYGNDIYVALFGNQLQYSRDHANWSDPTLSMNVHSLHFDGTDFRAFGAGSKAYVSRDGANWTPSTLPANFTQVFYIQKTFLALSPGPKLYTSSDGVTWVDRGPQPLFLSILNGSGTDLPQ